MGKEYLLDDLYGIQFVEHPLEVLRGAYEKLVQQVLITISLAECEQLVDEGIKERRRCWRITSLADGRELYAILMRDKSFGDAHRLVVTAERKVWSKHLEK